MVEFLKNDNKGSKENSFDRHSLSYGTHLGHSPEDQPSVEGIFGAYVEHCTKEGIVSFVCLELTKEQVNDGGGGIRADKTIPFDMTEEFAVFFRDYAASHKMDNKKAFNHLVADINSKKLTIPNLFRKLLALSTKSGKIDPEKEPETNRICLVSVGLASYAIKHLGMQLHNRSIRTLVTLFPNEYKNSNKDDGSYVFGSDDGNTLTEHNGPLTLVGFPFKEIEVNKPEAVKATPPKVEESSPKAEEKHTPKKVSAKKKDDKVSKKKGHATKEDVKEKASTETVDANLNEAPSSNSPSGLKDSQDKEDQGKSLVSDKVTEVDVDAMMDAPVVRKQEPITYYHDKMPEAPIRENPVEVSQKRSQSRFDDPMDFVQKNAPEPISKVSESEKGDWTDDEIESVARDTFRAISESENDDEVEERRDTIVTFDDDGSDEPAFDQTFRRSNGADNDSIVGSGSKETSSLVKGLVGTMRTRTGEHKGRLFIENPKTLPSSPTRRPYPRGQQESIHKSRPPFGHGPTNYHRHPSYQSSQPSAEHGFDFSDGNVYGLLYLRYLEAPHFVTEMRPINITSQYIKVRDIYKNSKEARGYGLQHRIDSEPAGDMVIITRMVDSDALTVLDKAGHTMRSLLSQNSIELLSEMRDKVTNAGFDFDFSKTKLEMIVSVQSILKLHQRRYSSDIRTILIQMAGSSRGFI